MQNIIPLSWCKPSEYCNGLGVELSSTVYSDQTESRETVDLQSQKEYFFLGRICMRSFFFHLLIMFSRMTNPQGVPRVDQVIFQRYVKSIAFRRKKPRCIKYKIILYLTIYAYSDVFFIDMKFYVFAAYYYDYRVKSILKYKYTISPYCNM